ncbi:MAG: Ig-like domain-containing protein [Gammaproteobacteria bacterium]|nr:Ig-like domain-containing protein [Gammaproteobacteria bacterium]
MLKKLISLGLVVASAALASCGGDNTIVDPGSGGGGGGGGGDTIVVTMGSGVPPAFSAGTIEIAVPSLAAGGGTSLRVSLATGDGNLYLQDTTITFSSACIAQGLATAPAVSTSTGVATTTYSATGCSGSDVITASAIAEGRSTSATGTVTVAAAVVGSIEFVSATPQKIGLQGTGGVGIPETSTVIFRVVDATGGPVAGAPVAFTLDSSVGGITYSPASTISGADGRVQTVVTSGTVATSVRVSAIVTGLGIGTQSSQLVITTGLPDKDSVSLAVRCNNVEGWDLDGTEVDVTVRLADRFNNPVPDGTAVTLNTEGGNILGSCSTTTTPTQSGVCTVTWTSSNPRPPLDGRSTIIATAIGEESFVDVNGNGIFDGIDTWTDLAEAFRDDDESGTYDPGEFFLDYNQDLVRSPADGQFNGLLCAGPGSPAGGCSANQKLTVSASNLIIMSGSTAKISDSAGGDNFDVGFVTKTGAGVITFTIGDFRDQPMPAETTIKLEASAGITLGNPKSYTVPCTTFNGPLQYSFFITSITGPGQLTLTVEVPSGLQTVYFVGVTP